MTEPSCPGCRERDARIADLLRRLGEVGITAPESPGSQSSSLQRVEVPDALTAPGKSGRRVRVVTDKKKHRRHRLNKLFQSMARVAMWVALVVVSAMFIWWTITMLGAGGPPAVVGP